jgi:hypothetical protein
MKRNRLKGVAIVEFSFAMLVMIPLLLGTIGVGFQLLHQMQTIQLARDAGRMYARGLDFSQPGNQTILVNLGSTLGLSATAGSGSAVVILSKLTYVDNAACAAAGAVDSHGNPSGCTNLGKWVFTQRLEIGNSSVRTSNMGSPLTSGPTGVTVNSTTGNISLSDYVTKAGAVATFSSINPYSVVNGNVSGLPSGQVLYVAETAATAFSMPPFIGPHATYSYGLF